jgi:hypothetical protein
MTFMTFFRGSLGCGQVARREGRGTFWAVPECGKAALECSLAESKVIMLITCGGKVIMRLPSTGGKVIKVIT